jgi:hypothetical protein
MGNIYGIDFGDDAQTRPEPESPLQAPLVPEVERSSPSEDIYGIDFSTPEPDPSERNVRLAGMAGVNPDDTAKQKAIAGQLGVPLRAVQEAPDYAEELANNQRASAALKGSKATRMLLTDPEAALLAFDQTEALAKIEEAGDKPGAFARSAMALGQQTVKFIPHLGASVDEMIGMVFGGLDAMHKGFGEATGLGYDGSFARLRDWAQDDADNIRNLLEGVEWLRPSEVIDGRRLVDENWNVDWGLFSDPEFLINTFGEAAPSLAATIAAAYMSGGSSAVGGIVGGMMEAGALFNELISEDVDNQTALNSSILFGITTGALNKLGLDGVLGGKGARTFAGRAARGLLGATSEGLTEYAEEPYQALFSGLARGLRDDELHAEVVGSLRNLESFVGGFLGGSGPSLVTSIQRRAHETTDNAASASFADAQRQLSEAVDTNGQRLIERDPALMERFLDEHMGLGKQDAFIEGETILELNQSAPGVVEEFARTLGVEAVKVVQDAEQGRDIRVDLGAFHTRLSTEVKEQLFDSIKPSPGAHSVRQVREGMAMEAGELQERFDAYASEQSEFTAQQQRIEAEAIQVGASPQVAREAAQTLARAVTSLAMRSDGVSASELMARVQFNQPRNIVAGQDVDGVTYNQETGEAKIDTPEFKRWFGDSQVVDAEGKPLVVYHGTQMGDTSDKEFVFTPGANEGTDSIQSEATFFTPDIDAALEYGDGRDSIFKVYLQAEDPLYVNSAEDIEEFAEGYCGGNLPSVLEENGGLVDGSLWETFLEAAGNYADGMMSDFINWAREEGYDSVVFVDNTRDEGQHKTYAVFDPTQIKSVYNLGTFDPYDERIFYQGAKGATQIRSDGYIVNLFENADASTPFHEMAHVFFEEMGRLVDGGYANQALQEDYLVARKWLSDLDSDEALAKSYSKYVQSHFGGRTFDALTEAERERARQIAKHEKFARGFETYLMEGKAPTPELMGAFARFKRWLKQIYKHISQLDAKLTPEVRGVFDRLLVAESNVELAADMVGLSPMTKAEMDSLGISVEDQEYLSRIMGDAQEKAEAALLSARKKGVRGNRENWKRQAEEEIAAKGVHTAMDKIVAGRGIDPDVAAWTWGEETVEAIRGRFGEKKKQQEPKNERGQVQSPNQGTDYSRGTITESARRDAEIEAKIREFASRDDGTVDIGILDAHAEVPFGGIWEELNIGHEEFNLFIERLENDVAQEQAGLSAEHLEILREDALSHLYIEDFESPVVRRARRVLSATSVTNAYGTWATRELMRKFGPGFFAKDSQYHIDELADWAEQNGYLGDTDDIVDYLLGSASRKEIAETHGVKPRPKSSGNKPPRGKKLFKEGGMSPEEAAVEAGFASMEDFLSALENYLPFQKAVKARVAELQAEFEQSLKAEDFLVQTDGYADYLGVLANYVQSKGQIMQADPKSRKAVARSAFKAQARRAVEQMSVRDATRVDLFMSAVKRSTREERLAIKKGDWGAAARAGHKARLNFEMAAEARRVREEIESGRRAMLRAVKHKTMRQAQRDLLLDLAYRFGFKRRAGETIEQTIKKWNKFIEGQAQFDASGEQVGGRSTNFSAWAAEAAENGYPVAFADIVSDRSNLGDYKDLTVNQFRSVMDARKQIETVDREERTVLINGERKAVKKVVGELVEQLKKTYAPKDRDRFREQYSKAAKTLRWLRSMDAEMVKIEHLLRVIDGDDMGVWFDTFYRPADDAASDKNTMLARISKDLKNLLDSHYSTREQGGLLQKRIRVREVGKTFTHGQIVRIALDFGNEGNYTRRRDGDGWSDAQMQAVVSKLGKRDWDFVQAIWDYIDTYGGPAFDLEERLTGRRPTKVEAREVRTPHGVYRGGYFPVIISHNDSSRQQARLDLEKAKLFGKSPTHIMTKHGHLKERAQSAGSQPLSTDLGDIAKHLLGVTHDLTHRERVVQMGKVLRDKEFISAAETYLGKELADQLVPWAKDIANVPPEPVNSWERLFRHLRIGTTVARLAKVSVGMQQAAGVLQSAAVLKKDWWRLLKVYSRPDKFLSMARFADANSAFMRDRIANVSRETTDVFSSLSMRKKALDKAGDVFLRLIGVAQKYTVDVATWGAAFDAEMEKSGDHERAARYADSVVRMSQGGGEMKDRSKIQRSHSEFVKMATMFYSFLSTAYNMIGKPLRGRKVHFAEFAWTATLLAVLGPSVAELLSGRPPDEDQDETWTGWAAQNSALFLLGMFPYVRDVGNAVVTPYDYSITPVESGLKSAIWLLKHGYEDVVEEGEYGMAAKKALDVAGMLLRLPTDQAWITGEAAWRAIQDDPDFEMKDLAYRKRWED